jgi:hypothetical protein
MVLIRGCRCCAELHFRNTVGRKLCNKCLLLKKILHEYTYVPEENYTAILLNNYKKKVDINTKYCRQMFTNSMRWMKCPTGLI